MALCLQLLGPGMKGEWRIGPALHHSQCPLVLGERMSGTHEILSGIRLELGVSVPGDVSRMGPCNNHGLKRPSQLSAQPPQGHGSESTWTS